MPLYSKKEVKFPKGLRDFVWGLDDLTIFEPDGKFNANLAIRAVIRRFKYSNIEVADRLGVDPVQVCRWANYKNRVSRSWTLIVYNEFFAELDVILGGSLRRSFKKDPDKIWKADKTQQELGALEIGTSHKGRHDRIMKKD